MSEIEEMQAAIEKLQRENAELNGLILATGVILTQLLQANTLRELNPQAGATRIVTNAQKAIEAFRPEEGSAAATIMKQRALAAVKQYEDQLRSVLPHLMTGIEGRLYLEDLSVGQRFESATHQMTVEEIKRFAGAFDPQPFHLDEEAAKTSLFGALAASGWHTGAVTMRLLVDGGAPIAGGVIGAGGEIVWPRPTRPGDVLQVFSEVLEIRPSRSKPDRGMVTVRSETRNQHGEVVQVLTSKLVVPRRPGAA